MPSSVFTLTTTINLCGQTDRSTTTPVGPRASPTDSLGLKAVLQCLLGRVIGTTSIVGGRKMGSLAKEKPRAFGLLLNLLNCPRDIAPPINLSTKDFATNLWAWMETPLCIEIGQRLRKNASKRSLFFILLMRH